MDKLTKIIIFVSAKAMKPAPKPRAMIDYSQIAFTTEEQNEITQLETTFPDRAFYLKTHLALEKLKFIIIEDDYDTSTQETLKDTVCLLFNKKGEKLLDLLNDWISEEYNDGDMTFVKLSSPEFPNVTINYRKQTEKITNRFSINIKE